MRKLTFLISTLVLLAFSCKKKGNGTEDLPPSNLQVTANVSTDNSGNVQFVATATNAVSYEYGFGNGVFQTVSSGTVTYKYPASGTYTVTVTARSAGGQTVSTSIQVTVTVTLTLVWSDEFDAPGAPNPAKWGYDLGAGGWGNNEVQYYTNRLDNAVVSGGTLKIILKKETFSGSPYTSARLLSKDKYSFKYGKIEARAKLPAGGGTWPAIWMLGNNIGSVSWPACGEIDIMEHVGNSLNKIYGTVHYPGASGGSAIGGTVNISNVSTEFHLYAVEWTPSSIKFQVDGVTFFTFTNAPALPFNQNFFIILNIAMGGNFGGAIDPAFTESQMEIDYVRVYQ